MSTLRRRTETVANVVLIICGSLFCVFLVKNYLLGKNQQSQSPDRPSLVGKSLPAVNIDWAKNGQTLLVVLQRGCHFCDESTPFYQRLTKEFATKPKPQLVAVMSDSPDEIKKYLEDKKVDLSEIRQISPGSLGVAGTPTLLLVDSKGVVLNEWRGKLASQQEQAVIAQLDQSRRSE